MDIGIYGYWNIWALLTVGPARGGLMVTIRKYHSCCNGFVILPGGCCEIMEIHSTTSGETK